MTSKTKMPKEVEQMQTLHLEGDITPPIWFRRIGYTTSSGKFKTSHLACLILADVAWWYRPQVIRHELTGDLVEVRKKFSGDLLQRSYDQISEKLGCSLAEAKASVILLETMGLIQRVVKPYKPGSRDRLYLRIIPDQVKALTYEDWIVKIKRLPKGGFERVDEGRKGMGCACAPHAHAHPDGVRVRTPTENTSTETTITIIGKEKNPEKSQREKTDALTAHYCKKVFSPENWRTLERVRIAGGLKEEEVEREVLAFAMYAKEKAKDDWPGFREFSQHLINWIEYQKDKKYRKNGNNNKPKTVKHLTTAEDATKAYARFLQKRGIQVDG